MHSELPIFCTNSGHNYANNQNKKKIHQKKMHLLLRITLEMKGTYNGHQVLTGSRGGKCNINKNGNKTDIK
ncbi:hypothetical protein NBC122_01910 [Chryseobacterium salivictor]|uniref:Uncharacterized protein n=1 Tax=Chryseobacterium salivictor TaxID=2547600 RepID=A0A4P6ZGJ3_9FLAO|nr:hypothetical protein NBC122_01910 [Chryseobacterium salivictor]